MASITREDKLHNHLVFACLTFRLATALVGCLVLAQTARRDNVFARRVFGFSSRHPRLLLCVLDGTRDLEKGQIRDNYVAVKSDEAHCSRAICTLAQVSRRRHHLYSLPVSFSFRRLLQSFAFGSPHLRTLQASFSLCISCRIASFCPCCNLHFVAPHHLLVIASKSSKFFLRKIPRHATHLSGTDKNRRHQNHTLLFLEFAPKAQPQLRCLCRHWPADTANLLVA